MITTDDAEVAKRCRLIRAHGMAQRYYHDMLGYNFRLSDLHAAIGIAQMHRLEAFTATRQANAAFLNQHTLVHTLRLPILVDGRGFFNPEQVAQSGLLYRGIGRSARD